MKGDVRKGISLPVPSLPFLAISMLKKGKSFLVVLQATIIRRHQVPQSFTSMVKLAQTFPPDFSHPLLLPIAFSAVLPQLLLGLHSKIISVN